MDARGLLLVVAAAVAGAITIPLDRPGLGWAMAGVVVLGLLRNWLGLAAAVLLCFGAVHSADWVFALCAVTALLLLAVTVVDGQTWWEIGFALPRWVRGSWQGLRSVATTSDRHGAARLARGIGAGLILVIVFGLLLSSAEQKFADLLRPLLSWPRLVTFTCVALLGLGALRFRRGHSGGLTLATADAHDVGRQAEPVVLAEDHGPAPHDGTLTQREEASHEGEPTAGGEAVKRVQAVRGAAVQRGEVALEAGGARPGVRGAGVVTGEVAESARLGDRGTGDRRAGDSVAGDRGTGDRGKGDRGIVRPVSAAAMARQRPLGAGRREWSRLEWAIPVALVDLLFLTFAIVQFTVLFGGHERVLDPEGPTYAQYAWNGFVQLAAVTVLTLAVVAMVLSRVANDDARLARVLVGLLAGLTLVIVGSALGRMKVYVEAFGFTRGRLLATAFIVWLGLTLLLLLAVWRRAVLPRLTLAAGALVLLALVALNPDRVVAQTVIGRWEKDGHLDAPYLASLSLDALPALGKLPEPKRSCIEAVIVRNNQTRPDAWNEWNATRAGVRGISLRDWEDCGWYLSVGYRLEGNWTDPSEGRRDG